MNFLGFFFYIAISTIILVAGSYCIFRKQYTKTVSVVATGYQYIDVKEDNLGIEPGDIIAHSTIGGAVLAQVSFDKLMGESFQDYS